MATVTNKAIGKTPTWTDKLQFMIHGSEATIRILVSDRLASHDSNNEKQIFVTASVDLKRFLGAGSAKDSYSNWYDLMCDGNNVGQMQLCFEFSGRPLTEAEHGYEKMANLTHQFDYIYEQWAHHTATCAWHKTHGENLR